MLQHWRPPCRYESSHPRSCGHSATLLRAATPRATAFLARAPPPTVRLPRHDRIPGAFRSSVHRADRSRPSRLLTPPAHSRPVTPNVPLAMADRLPGDPKRRDFPPLAAAQRCRRQASHGGRPVRLSSPLPAFAAQRSAMHADASAYSSRRVPRREHSKPRWLAEFFQLAIDRVQDVRPRYGGAVGRGEERGGQRDVLDVAAAEPELCREVLHVDVAGKGQLGRPDALPDPAPLRLVRKWKRDREREAAHHGFVEVL